MSGRGGAERSAHRLTDFTHLLSAVVAMIGCLAAAALDAWTAVMGRLRRRRNGRKLSRNNNNNNNSL